MHPSLPQHRAPRPGRWRLALLSGLAIVAVAGGALLVPPQQRVHAQPPGAPLSFAHRWDRCRDRWCTARTVVARTRSYRVRGADRGRQLRFTVIAANAVGRATAASALTRPVR